MKLPYGLIDLARGHVKGYSKFEKFGRNALIGTGTTPEDIWHGGGIYTGFPAINDTVDFSSDSADDNGVTPGIGLRTLIAYGQLDGVAQTEPITLNGTTKVTSALQWSRMPRLRGKTAGTNETNTGIITAAATNTPTDVFCKMPAGSSRTQIVAWTVPLGKTLYIHTIDVSLIRAGGLDGSGTVAIMMHEPGGVWEQMFTRSLSTGGSIPQDTDYFFEVIAGADCVARVLDVSDNSTEVTAHLNGVYVKD